MKREQPFATEVALCSAFIEHIDKRKWIAYAETEGWDILLVRRSDGFQIGVQAKLKLNAKVFSQALDEYAHYSPRHQMPDCRAVLVPDGQAYDWRVIAAYVGVTIISLIVPTAYRREYRFEPQLPGELHQRDWIEDATAERHSLPEYVPDVLAGAPSPTTLTTWKIKAIKLTILMKRQGYLTREDFGHVQMDHRRWTASGSGWVEVQKIDGAKRYVASKYFPNFEKQHPIVHAKIEADFEKWAPKSKS